MLKSLVFLSFLCVSSSALSQNARLKTFPLGKEFVAQITGCMDKDAAIATVDGFKVGKEEGAEVTGFFLLMGMCGKVTALITVKSLVHSVITSEGVKLNVYEVEINGKPFWSITDWSASGGI